MSRGLVSAALLVAFSASDAHAQYPAAQPVQQPGYVRLAAPLNPVPRPNIPHQVGGTYYTNQAFYAHEMLYPHRYHAVYPPYYYKVNYGLFGEQWKLQGTEVKVNYKSRRSWFALFVPPSSR